MLGELLEEMPGTKGEDAAVPAVAPVGQEGLRGREVGLFDEALDAIAAFERFAALDVAVAGFGRRRRDPEGDEPVLGGEPGSRGGGGAKSGHVGDVVIARADQHDRVGRQPARGERNRRGGVLGFGLDDDGRAWRFSGLLLDMFEVRGSGDDHRSRELLGIAAAGERRLEHRLLTDQRQERLGLGLATARPQPRAAAAAKDHRNDLVHCVSLSRTSPSA